VLTSLRGGDNETLVHDGGRLEEQTPVVLACCSFRAKQRKKKRKKKKKISAQWGADGGGGGSPKEYIPVLRVKAEGMERISAPFLRRMVCISGNLIS
jgi:hypothetical protein